MATSFDLFGTLAAVDRPDDPAAAVARELRARDVAVPDDWDRAYRESHVASPPGAAVPLPAHVAAALRSRDATPADGAVRRAVAAAFDPEVRVRDGARAAVAAAAGRGPVGLCSNCSVPGLVERTLERGGFAGAFDAAIASVDCGWRKPDRRAFEAVAAGLDVPLTELVHVGDDPATDGGIEAAGGRYVDVRRAGLAALADRWRDAP